MKRLIICNTYMQLITAIQMKCTLFRTDTVDLWISDHSVDAERVAERAGKLELFHDVEYKKTKNYIHMQNKTSDLLDVIRLNFGRISPICWESYEEIIFYNSALDLYRLADWHQKIGKSIVWSKMEEGILSYNFSEITGMRMKLTRRVRRFIRRPDVMECISRYYCFYTELKEGDKSLDKIRIPLLNRRDFEVLKTLNAIFDYHPEEDSYPQKYLFFASSSDIDGNGTGETELVLRIADIVGKKNLLVKMHPRDDRHVYEDYGIAVSRNSAIPWEVIQLNHDFSDHVFLSLSSGSVLNASVMLGDEIRTRYLYPLVRKRNEQFYLQNEKTIGGTLRKLKEIGKCRSFRIVTENLERELS